MMSLKPALDSLYATIMDTRNVVRMSVRSDAKWFPDRTVVPPGWIEIYRPMNMDGSFFRRAPWWSRLWRLVGDGAAKIRPRATALRQQAEEGRA